LLKDNSHIRGLAKQLKTNQMMVSRKIKELEKDNVVDFRQEGKNKVYFLKKTVEAQEHAYLFEHYRLLQALRQYSLLKGIIQNIRLNPKVRLVILFGSYAKGTAHKDSDIDVYAETMGREIKKEIELINSRLSVKIGKYDKKSLLIQEIEKNHIIIKGAEIYYEKNKFFE